MVLSSFFLSCSLCSFQSYDSLLPVFPISDPANAFDAFIFEEMGYNLFLKVYGGVNLAAQLSGKYSISAENIEHIFGALIYN